MKILHILAQLPGATGSGVYFANLIRELERYGHEQAAIFGRQDDCFFPLPLPSDRQYPVDFKTSDLPFPIPGMSDVMPYDSTRYSAMSPEMMEQWLKAFQSRLEQAGTDFRPEVLILHHLWILTSLALDIFPGLKSIGVCHHTDLRQARNNPSLRERYVNKLHRLTTILSLSDAHQNEIRCLHACAGTKLVTMGGGFDQSLFFPGPKKRSEGPVRILYAGKIDPSKGVYALIEAFLALRQADSDLCLSIVGSPNTEQAAKLSQLTGGNSSIQLYPAQSQARLAEIMREHDLFVLPSFFEGLGLIAIEALACGLWTVATEIEGLVSLLGERVIQSGAIEFVPLPKMEGPGVPRESQVGDFVEGLAAKLALQIGRARRGDGFPQGLLDDISRHSWRAIAARINAVISD